MRYLIDGANHEERLYVYNMHNIGEKHFSISISPMRSRGGSLVINKYQSFLNKVINGIVTGAKSISSIKA
jgi:hypothetical protein